MYKAIVQVHGTCIHPEERHVQHPRQRRNRVPVGHLPALFRSESPFDGVDTNTICNHTVVVNILAVVVIDKFKIARLPIEPEGDSEEREPEQQRNLTFFYHAYFFAFTSSQIAFCTLFVGIGAQPSSHALR